MLPTQEIREMINEVPLDSRGVDRLATICVALCDKIDSLERSIYRAANEASCLANGIIPD